MRLTIPACRTAGLWCVWTAGISTGELAGRETACGLCTSGKWAVPSYWGNAAANEYSILSVTGRACYGHALLPAS